MIIIIDQIDQLLKEQLNVIKINSSEKILKIQQKLNKIIEKIEKNQENQENLNDRSIDKSIKQSIKLSKIRSNSYAQNKQIKTKYN